MTSRRTPRSSGRASRAAHRDRWADLANLSRPDKMRKEADRLR